MKSKLRLLLVFFMALGVQVAFAQETTITGTVYDDNGQPLPGANIEVEGTSTGTTTNFDGEYSIKAEVGSTLVFSSLGLGTVRKQVQEGEETLDVTMKTSSESLAETVITAYGIEKERKSLGYAQETISGEDILESRQVNVTDALAGKVSGLQLSTSGAGPGGSSKIILRGFNSLTGDNQPLIVVDGVPMTNFVGADNNDFWNPSVDMGNGLSDLNPADIKSINVLKGGAASALYGSRAGNGVIEITTKQGKETKGAGITYSNTLSFNTLMARPDLQKEYSQGSSGAFIKDAEKSWGEKITGQTVERWDGKEEALNSYDNIENFFKTGIVENNSLSLQKKVGENTGLYSSVSYVSDDGMIPGTELNRLNATTRVTTKYGKEDRWSTDVKLQYINSIAKNRPIGGQGQSYYGGVLTMPTTVDVRNFEEGMKEKGADATSNWYIPNDRGNPYWAVHNRLNKDNRNRFMLNADLGYEFADWINFHAKVGSDFYNTKTERKIYTGGPIDNQYETGQDKSIENNFIANLNLHQDNIVGKWSGALSLFGQIMKRSYNKQSIHAILDVPNYFTVGNDVNNMPDVSEDRTKQQINSFFGTMDIDYDGFWFLNLTARNDWSSTMSKENRSYFYPSVSTSLVLTDMFRKVWGSKPFGDVINFAKLRGSYAATGNSLDPYSLYNEYTIDHDPLGNITASGGGTLFNSNVRSELLKTYEFGLNVRLFNRIDLDVNFYDTHAKRQLIALPMNPLSGYDSRMINAGDIQNKGFEITLNADIFKTPEFLWNFNANFSKNTNKIVSLTEGVDVYPLGGFDDVSIVADVGERYGVIKGTKYARVEDESSEYYGEKIVDGEGLPTKAEGGSYNLGDQTPRANVGITNSFSYKNFNLSFQIDGRFGGKFFSGTMNSLKDAGLAEETVVDGTRDNFVVDGVIQDDQGNYAPNTTEVSAQEYWERVSETGNLGINEENVFDATNIRLRNVRLGYNLPESLLEKTPINSARISFSVNNAWMIYSKVKGIDPEATYAVSSNATGFENLTFPSTREFVFNLTVSF